MIIALLQWRIVRYVCLLVSIVLVFLSRDIQANLLPHLDRLLYYSEIKAFLDVVAYAEGTMHRNGYNMLYGGPLFYDFSDHPRQVIARKSGNRILSSSAAGRYQILARTWDSFARKLRLFNFGPKNQDKLALALIRQMGALQDVIVGRFEKAIRKVARIWASLPGAKYKQRTLPLKHLKRLYLARLKFYQKKK